MKSPLKITLLIYLLANIVGLWVTFRLHNVDTNRSYRNRFRVKDLPPKGLFACWHYEGNNPRKRMDLVYVQDLKSGRSISIGESALSKGERFHVECESFEVPE